MIAKALNHEDIIRLAHEAGATSPLDCTLQLKDSEIIRFAELVAAEVLEKGARFCETEFCGDDVSYYVATGLRVMKPTA